MQTTPTTTESTPTQSARPPLTPEALQVLLTTPVKLETKHPTRYYVKQPLHKGRVEGAANYNGHDTDLLLNIIERIKPVGGMMWQKVEEQFNAQANVQRPLKSLKEKFKSLRLTRYSTGDPHMPEPVRRAKQLYDNILSEHKVTEIGPTLSTSPSAVVDTSPDSSPTASPHSELNTTTATSSDSVSSTAVHLSSLRLSASHKHPRNDESPATTSASDAESTTPYTSAHKRRRRLEDAVFAIAESCKRDNDKTEQHNAVVSMLSSMQQQQQLFMQQQQQQQQQLLQQFMHASQQQQQFQAIQQQQQQQFFIQLLDKLTQTQSSTQQQKSDQR